MRGKITETRLVPVPHLLGGKNAGFDWTGDLLQVKAKFMAQAELESKLAGFQTIALSWLSSSKDKRLLAPSFSFHLEEKNGTQFWKKRLPMEQRENLKASSGSNKNVVKCIFRLCMVPSFLCTH